MSSIAERLREERERCGMKQQPMADLGRVGLRSQTNYEIGKYFPDAEYLRLVDSKGVDVLYVITGRRQVDGATLDRTMLEQVIVGVEAGLRQLKVELEAEKKAELIILLYDHCKQQGQVEAKTTERFLRLVS